MRLDKFLTKCGLGSRTQVKSLLKQGRIKANEEVIKSGKYDCSNQIIKFDDMILEYREYVYLMLNKPSGIISATKDNFHKTVIDLVEDYAHYDLHPIGRLDIDTEGLVILTNDGQLTHDIISPKKHVPKEYYAVLRDDIGYEAIVKFNEGIVIDDYKCMSSELTIINQREVKLIIYEGKFHQVKRMFLSFGNKVEYLKRLSINGVELDESLEIGMHRELTFEELNSLKE